MERADAEARALREAGAEGQRRRVEVLTSALEVYGEAFREGESEHADSLAGILWERLAFSHHALGDTVGWAEASEHRLRLLYTVGDSTRQDEAVRTAYAVGMADYARGLRALRTLEEAALARGDTVTFFHAQRCAGALVRQRGGEAVAVAQRDTAGGPFGPAAGCDPTDARLVALLLALVALTALVVVFASHRLSALRVAAASAPARTARTRR